MRVSHSGDHASWYIHIFIDALISQFYFWNKTLYVSDSSSFHHREFFTVHTAVVYVIQLVSRIRTMSWSCSQAVSKPVWHMPLLCIQWKTPDDGQRNCPKHVEFYSKNKFQKLVHLVGFIIWLARNCDKIILQTLYPCLIHRRRGLMFRPSFIFFCTVVSCVITVMLHYQKCTVWPS